jgi:hypothetical protein
MPQNMRYVLYVDNKGTDSGSSLDDAKEKALQYLPDKRALKIMCVELDRFRNATAAPSVTWAFDYATATWALIP